MTEKLVAVMAKKEAAAINDNMTACGGAVVTGSSMAEVQLQAATDVVVVRYNR
jgi:hypothetical protein